MLRIANFSKVNMECKFNDRLISLEPGASFECNEKFDSLWISPKQTSYSLLEAKESKILKGLSFFDDPFKLIKEYHLVVNCLFKKENLCDSNQLNITLETCYADIDTRTYYDYVKLEVDSKQLKPIEVEVSSKDEICGDFILNNSKLAKWQAIWDIIIEPFVLELVGYYLAYRILSVWFEKKAWLIIISLLIITVFLEVLAFSFSKRKYKKRLDKFQQNFSRDTIYDNCYNN